MTGQGESAYAASKAGVAYLGRNFARAWVHMGINVNVIQPCYILTDLSRKWFESERGKAQIAQFPRRRLRRSKRSTPCFFTFVRMSPQE